MSQQPIRPLRVVSLDELAKPYSEFVPPVGSLMVVLESGRNQLGLMANRQQVAFYELLVAECDLVAVTDLPVEACKQLKLRFAGGFIANRGATIIYPDGSTDAEWEQSNRDRVSDQFIDVMMTYSVLLMRVRDAKLPVDVCVQSDRFADGHHHPLFLRVKPLQHGLITEPVATFFSTYAPGNWEIDSNRSYIDLVPPIFDQVAALQRYISVRAHNEPGFAARVLPL